MADAVDQFLGHLAGVTDPETKRKIIGREFIRVFEEQARALESELDIEFLVQGTLYPDVVESGGGEGAATIKSHHNVGGLPDDLQFTLIEPLRTLFKDEVRQVGLELGLPDHMIWRHPFPGPGLGIRIIGEVTRERLDILREADAIAREELTASGLDRDIWQFPVVLLADVQVGGRAGRRPYVRAPDRAAPRHERGRHDGRLGQAPVRPAREDLHPHHQRGARGEPRRGRHHEQAAGHHRVGVTEPFTYRVTKAGQVLVSREGRQVVTVSGAAAASGSSRSSASTTTPTRSCSPGRPGTTAAATSGAPTGRDQGSVRPGARHVRR